MNPILQRLKERKLVQWGLAYAAGAFVALQLMDALEGPIGLTQPVQQALLVLLLVGFPVTLVLAWYHGEKGRQRVTGPELVIIAGILALGAMGLRFLPRAEVPLPTVEDVPPPEAGSIAVLPFENLSPDEEDAVFTDGFHEELIARLTQVSGLKVISRTSVMEYREGSRNLREIAERLRVRNVVEGSVRWAGETVRITVQLIDATTDEGRWSDAFNEQVSLDNLIEMQTTAATQIATALEVELSPEESRRLEYRPTDDFDAYRLYQLGRSHFNQRTRVGLTRAIELYQQAADRDEDYALAYVGLSDARAMLAFYGWLPTIEAMSAAKTAARHALAIDPDNGQAQIALGEAVWYADWDWMTGEAQLEAGRAAAPSYAQGHHWHSYLLAARGDHGRAQVAISEALSLDPLSLIVNTWAGVIHRHARRPEEAIRQFELTLALDGRFALAHGYLGFTYATLGRFDEAIRHLETATEIDPDGTRLIGMLGYAYGLAGRVADAEAALARLESMRTDRHVSSYDIGLVQLGLGEEVAAFRSLAAAADDKDTMMLVIGQEPAFDRWNDDPRFAALLDRVGAPLP